MTEILTESAKGDNVYISWILIKRVTIYSNTRVFNFSSNFVSNTRIKTNN